jgi:hypothetical protein
MYMDNKPKVKAPLEFFKCVCVCVCVWITGLLNE